MSSVVPITIREHLVPFFFKETKGQEMLYLNKKVKGVSFSSNASSVGKIIRMLMVKSGQPLKVSAFNLCLSVTESAGKKQYKGAFYKLESGRNSFLKLPEEANNDINDLLEDMFRMAFTSYVDGCVESNGEAVVVYAIDKFIEKYDLLEFGFCNDTLRRLYYREKDKDKMLSRFQN